jgi:hypothetical protein
MLFFLSKISLIFFDLSQTMLRDHRRKGKMSSSQTVFSKTNSSCLNPTNLCNYFIHMLCEDDKLPFFPGSLNILRLWLNQIFLEEGDLEEHELAGLLYSRQGISTPSMAGTAWLVLSTLVAVTF